MPLVSRSRFAALARVGPKALLVWQDAGVLVPVRVDPDGTRWYDPSQLPRASAVRLLRDLGVPLAEVPALLDRPVPPPSPSCTPGSASAARPRPPCCPPCPRCSAWRPR